LYYAEQDNSIHDRVVTEKGL